MHICNIVFNLAGHVYYINKTYAPSYQTRRCSEDIHEMQKTCHSYMVFCRWPLSQQPSSRGPGILHGLTPVQAVSLCDMFLNFLSDIFRVFVSNLCSSQGKLTVSFLRRCQEIPPCLPPHSRCPQMRCNVVPPLTGKLILRWSDVFLHWDSRSISSSSVRRIQLDLMAELFSLSLSVGH